MPVFTVVLKDALQLVQDNGNGMRIGLDRYPLFDQDYRDSLNRKIIDHFWNREIGVETISMFTFNLRRKMNEIMPLYNQVYESTKIQFDPLATYNIKTVRDDTSTEDVTRQSDSNGSSDTTSASRSVSSSTPQTMLSGNGDYATSGADANSDSKARNTANGTDTTNGNTSMNGTSTTTGFQGAAADLLMKYRATLLNVDMLVIAELDELFMAIWDNEDEMLPAGYNGGYYF